MSNILYSPSVNGFFDDSIHTSVPKDAVKIDKNTYFNLLKEQSEGKRIVANREGYPITEFVVASDEVLHRKEREWRNSELCRADIELNKVQDSDSKAVGTVGQWRDYRKMLRAWPESVNFPDKNFRPRAPDHQE